MRRADRGKFKKIRGAEIQPAPPGGREADALMPFTASIDQRMIPRQPLRLQLDAPATGHGRDAAEEAGILHRMALGETEALHDLWEVWSRPLFAVAVRALGSMEDAEEVLQDALVRFWNKAAEYDSRQSQPFTWAVMILRGLIHDRLRARRRRPVLVSSHLHPDFAAEIHLPGQRGDLEQALSLLTPDERQALDIAVFHPATHEEIATRLGQPLGTVKSRIRRALDKLRSALTDDAP
ncbi:MAG: polymerase subunit sigma-70 [Verrucomicrobiales bacterium]|nr:polymerase subunit sigma-70 [Verrucomicrobiales bacterium]